MLSALIARLRGGEQVESLANTVASRSLEVVWHRVRSRLPTLGVNEARGYVKARAIGTIRDQIATMITAGTLAQRLGDRVFVLASEQVVQGMLQRWSSAPVRTATIRRAA